MTDKMKLKTSPQIIQNMGQRLERHRLMQNISQADLAATAGIGERTLRRIESGEGGSLDSFVRLLIALNLDDNLSLLVPDHHVRPIERLRSTKAERQRAGKPRTKTSPNKNETDPRPKSRWSWGDEKQ